MTPEEREELALHENYRDCLKSGSASAVLWDILSMCGIYDTMYGTENAQLNRQLGRREIGLEILAKLEDVDPTAYPTMVIKHIKDNTDD